jgi:hypothetical protein
MWLLISIAFYAFCILFVLGILAAFGWLAFALVQALRGRLKL